MKRAVQLILAAVLLVGAAVVFADYGPLNGGNPCPKGQKCSNVVR